MKIGLIGCGTIVDALVRSIAAHGHSIFVSERGAAISKALADSFDNVARAVNQDVISNSDVIVIGLVDSVAIETLSELKFSPDQRVISVMANMSLEEVQRLVAPAKADAVMIPFPGIANGGSPILVQGTNDLVRHFWGAENSLFDLATKTELDAYLCAQAVLSPVSRMIGEAADWLAPKLQDPSQGEAF
ncbi:MAG: NAD(P)-binding domain-containing protein, partial [Shimia sp.]|nr:NAD(P)-binding domain-containing protein [Shimia sp.]